MIKKVFNWIFQKQLKELEQSLSNCNSMMYTLVQQSKNLEKKSVEFSKVLDNFDVSVDVHQYSPSWAVISLQGEKVDYVKFLDLGDRSIAEIARFLSKYERGKVDATPHMRNFIKDEAMRIKRY
jgi:hypothetical protein